jgi:glycosyltransferase involved in cell wall biosynthesis
MKILIIALKVDNSSAAGIIFKNLAEALLKQKVELIILAQNVQIKECNDIVCFVRESFLKINIKVSKLLTIIFRRNWEHLVWQKFMFYYHRRNIKKLNPDLVLSFVSGNSPGIISLGEDFSKYLSKPLAIHMVDPIPPPRHYENIEIYRKGLFPGIKSGLKHSAFVSMGNPAMLRHQQKYCDFDLISKSTIIRDSINRSFTFFGPLENNESFTLLYLGNFGVKRNPENLIKAVCKIAMEDTNIKLLIVGDNSFVLGKLKLTSYCENNILKKSWTNNIDIEMQQANVLVDIDIDEPNDVFSSSKVKQYLFVDRPILAITRKGSPTHVLLSNCTNTVRFCENTVEQIYIALKEMMRWNYLPHLFEERQKILVELTADYSASKMLSYFQTIIDKGIV